MTVLTIRMSGNEKEQIKEKADKIDLSVMHTLEEFY